LSDFAAIGLRTLVLASKDVSDSDYSAWAASYKQALLADNEEEIDRLENEMEGDLTLIGATAIEDKLQVLCLSVPLSLSLCCLSPFFLLFFLFALKLTLLLLRLLLLQHRVPESIECMRMAGIKIWVLTGDKQETAMCIGNSCRLLHPGQTELVMNTDNMDDCSGTDCLSGHSVCLSGHAFRLLSFRPLFLPSFYPLSILLCSP
jgi:magnesium-transporting ATPase (P-type)